MAKHFGKSRAKRANKPNPREDRNLPSFLKTDVRDRDQDEELHLHRRQRVELIPRNLTQETYVEELLDENKPIVFAMGAAGTGKTMLATKYAVKALQEGLYDRIIITRPAVSVDEQHGFLPGTLVEKMQPWMLPILDVFKEHYSPRQIQRMIEEEITEIAPLAYCRGRTFKNAVIIADEMQNATISQMKMMLTRIGQDSRMIVTGDLRQHDRGYEENGLKDFVHRLKANGSRYMAVIEFTAADVERHPVIEDVLRLYGEADD